MADSNRCQAMGHVGENQELSPPGGLFISSTFEGWGEGGLVERGGLFNLAKCITGSLSTSSSQNQELDGHFPLELSFLLCKVLSREGCSLEFSPIGVRFLEEGLVVLGCYTSF